MMEKETDDEGKGKKGREREITEMGNREEGKKQRREGNGGVEREEKTWQREG